jgi:hypothetical protein
VIRIAALAFIVLACGQSDSAPGKKPDPKADVKPKADTGPVRVLFIGNSYTYTNDLPDVFEKLAAAGGRPKVQTEMIASGGVTLQKHLEAPEAREALGKGTWTYVVLQEQSTLGKEYSVDGEPRVSTDEVFHAAALKWTDEVKKRGATPVLYLTWARKKTPEDQAALDHAYMRAGRDTGARVSPIGIAWQETRKRHPEIELYQADGAHPSPAGSYLAACVLYATIFDRSPEGLPAKLARADQSSLVDLPADQAAALQARAAEVHKELVRQGGYLPTTAPKVPVSRRK